MVLCLPYARSLEFVMNDGGRGWDKARSALGSMLLSALPSGAGWKELQGTM